MHVTKEGFADVYQFVDVTYNRTATITVNLATNTIAGALAVESDTGCGQVFVIASCEPDVEIRIDGEPKGLTPLEGSIAQVAAGKRRLSLRRGSGPPLIREIPVEAGRRTDIGVTTGADGTMQAVVQVSDGNAPLPIDPTLVGPAKAGAVATSGPTNDEHHTGLLTAGIVTAGVGIASIAVGTLFSAKVHSDNKKADTQQALISAHQDNTPDDATIRANATKALQGLNKSGPSNEHKQWIFLGAGAGLVMVGGLMMAADEWHWFGIGTTQAARDPLAPTLKLGLVPAPGGGFMALGGTF